MGFGAQFEKRRMSKVRINDLAREMEVKSRQVLDILAESPGHGQDPLQFPGGD